MATRRKKRSTPAEGEENGVSPNWPTIFLGHLAETSNVTESAKRSGINPRRAYRKRRDDPGFATGWLAALWEGYTHLEMDVLRRLREGAFETGSSGKFDFANAIRLLAAHRESASQARAVQRNVSAAEIRASIDRKVEAIQRQVREEQARKAAKA